MPAKHFQRRKDHWTIVAGRDHKGGERYSLGSGETREPGPLMDFGVSF